ncbi:MAG: DNA recombination protein RmuC [Alphaproteobacteria bacterium]|nr:DNA recombination protein RmuC [Alphaproteobacteria bacterium]
MSQPFLTIGHMIITVSEALLLGASVFALLLITIVIMLMRAGGTRRVGEAETQRREAELQNQLAEMTGRLHTFMQATANRDAHMTQNLNERLDGVTFKLGQNLHENNERTGQHLQVLHERLAVIDTAQKNLTELSTQMVGLQDILANKQTRGAFGQAQMEAVIADRLPASAYAFQPTLSNGTRPDCIVKMPDGGLDIVIDAKFPLEAFTAFREASETPEIKAASQQLRGDMGKHIKDISEKYLIPGETQETALMFVPSESIYADLHEKFDDVVQKAYRARVMIVSPTMLMLAVQTLQTLFRDSQMREQAGLIQQEVGRMMGDVHRLRDRVLALQKHFGMANKDIDLILTSSDKVTKRALKIGQVELEDGDEPAVEDDQGPKLVSGGLS